MRDHVHPGRPGVGEQGVEDLAGIEHRAHRVAEQGLPPVMPGIP